VQIARDRASLGLPVPEGTRFRMAKRVVYKISWIFLRHQVEFNQRTVEVLAGVAADQQRLCRAMPNGRSVTTWPHFAPTWRSCRSNSSS
jgi:hypothetical protein